MTFPSTFFLKMKKKKVSCKNVVEPILNLCSRVQTENSQAMLRV